MKGNAARGCKKVQNFPGAPNGAPKSSKTIYLGLFFAAKRRFFWCFANKKAPLLMTKNQWGGSFLKWNTPDT